MSSTQIYDCAIIGGGLAGLALSVQLAEKGFATILFEKEQYPFHKVCGEYISLESLGFLASLKIPLGNEDLPRMKKLMISASNAHYFVHELPLGGFGISRYKLDKLLADRAAQAGVQLKERTKVTAVQEKDNLFCIETTGGNFSSRICCGAFGKRSNLDIKWQRSFTAGNKNEQKNFIGVKYHAQLNHPRDTIELHYFKEGYCGLSAIEDDKHCLCYLTTAQTLRTHHHNIREMEKNVLFKNPYLKEIFNSAHFLYAQPLTISQVSFAKKQQVDHGMILLGDAAGMIAPLCGNGMSMALHASKIAGNFVARYLQGNISRAEMEQGYQAQWLSTFGKRVQSGRIIQKLLGYEILNNLFVKIVQPFPAVSRRIISLTHGDPF